MTTGAAGDAAAAAVGHPAGVGVSLAGPRSTSSEIPLLGMPLGLYSRSGVILSHW